MSRSFFALLLVPAGLFAQDLKPVALPAPQTSGGKPLMQALKERKSTREFSPEKLSPQMLSNLLWAGWGINRENGLRTAPSSSNKQEIEIYAVTADGVFVYDAKGNALKPVVSGDLLILAGESAEESNVGLYRRYESWIRRNLSLTDSLLGATGPIYAIRRTLAHSLPEGCLLDDVWLPMQAVLSGYRSV